MRPLSATASPTSPAPEAWGLRARALVATGLLVLAFDWLGPLPALAAGAFSAHMTMHVLNVAVAAPLIAVGLAGTRYDPAMHWPRLLSPVPVSIVELVVIWGWHAPGPHHFARHTLTGGVLEQGLFLVTSLAVWSAAFGGTPERRAARAGAGIAGMLMTSMHMTLLGALLALSARSLYGHHTPAVAWLSAAADQQLGGVIMLAGGGISYLVGALVLLAGLLQERRP